MRAVYVRLPREQEVSCIMIRPTNWFGLLRQWRRGAKRLPIAVAVKFGS